MNDEFGLFCQFTDVLDFWFGKPDHKDYGKPNKDWFIKDSTFDEKIKLRFLSTYEKAASHKLDDWKNSPLSCLALILLLDQFPRNMFREQPQAFATDSQALEIAKYAIFQQFDCQFLAVQRWFIYLPFEHSENLSHQHQAIALFSTLQSDPYSTQAIESAYHHLNIIEQFGRFPHRNSILDRISTSEEIEFLEKPDSSF
ncbi:DUF924 family protein [Aphanothece sacrum]|uniref:Membrane protein n=1 Tax=Aphanothece sacrum FPU1 TaxID=1920663 RepID=A0A401IC34_APHSA|nr:DUF924 family protein [Aphanothece sacrum]GBF78786.1 membrane protein [Aphanothece sacrum FPU1]GBF83018.1 membrane protein [Aphanothece sacrum FPU3]